MNPPQADQLALAAHGLPHLTRGQDCSGPTALSIVGRAKEESMADIQIANAPVSWGTLEFEGLEGERTAYEQMLDELRDTGYVGTELGDWGYLPTEPGVLRAELERRRLAMVGAFVQVALRYEEAHARGEAAALKVARLLAAVTGTGSGNTYSPRAGSPPDFLAHKGPHFPTNATPALTMTMKPLLILADANGTDAVRTRYAGRITKEMGLSAAEWGIFAGGVERIARAVREETGLPTAFHHHCAGYVETPEEIACLLEMTESRLVGLVFDTGHYLYGSGSVDGERVLEGLERFGERIVHMHFKDCEPRIAERARSEGWDYFTAIQHGLFCELGRGSVPFDAVVERLRMRGYRGWIVVEQDVLPGMGSPKASAQRNREYLKTIGL